MTPELTVQDETANKSDNSAADGVQGDHADRPSPSPIARRQPSSTGASPEPASLSCASGRTRFSQPGVSCLIWASVRECHQSGSPIYAWPYEQRHAWRTQTCRSRAVLERVTRAR